MKRMLFNATHEEELRVAIVDGQKLIGFDIESPGKEQRKSNIYKGLITRVEPSLEAVFVDYGAERHGFLPFKEISRSLLPSQDHTEGNRPRIQNLLREGLELIAQVEKDERGNKGAALTTYISLAGRYLVLMPNNPKGGGVSRRVEGEDRSDLREVMDRLEVPGGMSVIARTAAIGRGPEELQWDLNYLLQLWQAIESASSGQKAPFLIYQESSLVIRAIRDYFQPDIGEILIDTSPIYDQALQFMGHVMPGNIGKVKLYQDDVPLFSRFQIEHQIETAYAREVLLTSGGAIMIDHTEAMVAIDVNSARATRGSDIEQTALNTNLEAAEEIARQLRLRDIGGLVVIDFIDMENPRNQREVENRFREALHYDRARVQMGKISRFGLLELSRQRLQPSLGETSHVSCPRCNGIGHIRSIESTALHILRLIQEEVMKENSKVIHVQMPVNVATFLLNEKRHEINTIEARFKVSVVLIPNPNLETPHYRIDRLRQEDLAKPEHLLPSYQMTGSAETSTEVLATEDTAKPFPQEAAVKGVTPAQPAPIIEEPTQTWLSKITSWFHGFTNHKEEKTEPKLPNNEERRPAPRRSQRPPKREAGPNRDERREKSEHEMHKKSRPMPHKRQSRPEGRSPALPKTAQQHVSQEPGGANLKRHRRDYRHEKEQNELLSQDLVAAENVTSTSDTPLPIVHDAQINEIDHNTNILAQIETHQDHERQISEEINQHLQENVVAEIVPPEVVNIVPKPDQPEPEQTTASESLVQIETKPKQTDSHEY